MASFGRWLVPFYLVIVGLILIGDGMLIGSDASANLPILQNHAEQGCSMGTTPCVSLSACQEECGLGQATVALGVSTLLVGLWVGVVRWKRSRPPSSRPPDPEPRPESSTPIGRNPDRGEASHG